MKIHLLGMELVLLFLLLTKSSAQQFDVAEKDAVKCPIGFNYLSSTNLCYQVKRHEKQWEKYRRCSSNEVSLNFRQEYKNAFKDYNINLFWTDYVRMYDGGPFVNWRYEDKDMGKPLNLTIYTDSIFHRCAFIEIGSGKVISDYCNNTYSRLCVVKPYSKSNPFYWDCPNGYTAYPAPIPTCLIAKNSMPSPRRVILRATWQQAAKLCYSYGGSLPQRGYMYLNHQEFLHINRQEIPLGMVANKGIVTWKIPYSSNNTEVSIYEHMFEYPIANATQVSGYIALKDDTWYIRPGGSIYNSGVCEAFITLPSVEINFITQRNKSLFLNVSRNIKQEDLWCFTDALTYYPVGKKIFPIHRNSNQTFFLETIGNGYYWCMIVNSREYIPTESKKYLFIENNATLRKVYAIKIQFYKDVGFSDYFIKEYLISYFSDYNLVFGNNKSEVLSILMNENGTLPDYVLRNKPLLTNIVVKSLYFGNKTALIHASFNNDFVRNYRLFKYFNFMYVRNVQYCEPVVGILNMTLIGETIDIVSECKRYTCAGDFNEGAYWLISDLEECVPQTTTTTELYTTTEPVTEIETTIMTSTTTITPKPSRPPVVNPDEEIDNVLNIIDDILSGPVNTSQLNKAVQVISNLFESVEDATFPSAILHNIDTMLKTVDLPDGKKDLMIVQPSLAVVVADKNKNSTVAGIKLKTTKGNSLDEDSLHLLREDDYVTNDEENDIIVKIPQAVSDSAKGRLSFTIFKDDKPFSQNKTTVNTRVLSITVNGMDIFDENHYIDMHFRPHSASNDNETKVCAYWEFKKDGTGKWSTDGCILLPAAGPGGLDTCRCTHLTHFAQLIIGSNEYFEVNHYNILTIISMVGCVLSLIGLTIIALTGMIFRSWRNDFSNKIWLHLTGAMSIMIFTFLLVAFGDIQNRKEIYCMITGVLLHYSVLASFGWMFISAVLSYQRLVTVFTKSSSHKLLKACVCGWVLPFIPIGVLFVFDANSYSQHFVLNELSNEICYPSGLGLWLTVFLPIAIIVIINAVLFFLIVYSVFINSKIKRHGDNRQLFRSISVSFLLFFLFGLTWIFGLFSQQIILAYLFCITATNQGLILCLFFIIGNKKTRDLWLVQLKVKEKKKIPSTTSMSRSYPSRGNSKSGRIISIKRNDDDLPAKPRSLSGANDKSDSRFS